jgi:hypothetical protein
LTGKHDVQDDRIEMVRKNHVQSLVTSVQDVYDQAAFLQPFLHEVRDLLFILYHQDSHWDRR